LPEKDKDRKRRRLRRGITLIPGMLSTANIFFGFLSITSAIKGEYSLAALCIGLAFLMDGLDGRIARLTNNETDFGLHLDSLADVVSFAVAPAVLCYIWGLIKLSPYGFPVSFLFVICGILRLARYNALSSSRQKKYFVGLPVPAAAATLGVLIFYSPEADISKFTAFFLLLLTIGLSLLMISKIRYKSFKDIDIKSRKPYSVILILAVIIGLIAIDPQLVLLLAAFTYTLSGPAAKLYAVLYPQKVMTHRKAEDPDGQKESVKHDAS